MLYFHGTGTSRFEPIAIADVMARLGDRGHAPPVGHGPSFRYPNQINKDDDTARVVNAAVR